MSTHGDGGHDGFALLRARKELRYTQEMMAEIMGCSRQYLSQMEKCRKPLNQKALMMLDEVAAQKPRYTPTRKPESAKKVAIKVQKTNELPDENCTKLVQFRKSATFPEWVTNGRSWERWWWTDKHPLCAGCARGCKQSVFIRIICPQYTPRATEI